MNEESRPPEPEVVVSGPAIEGGSEPRKPLDERRGDVGGETVHQGPGVGVAEEVLDQLQIGRLEDRDVVAQQLDGGGAKLKDPPAPESTNGGQKVRPAEGSNVGDAPSQLPAQERCAEAKEVQLALQVSLGAGSAIGAGMGAQGGLDGSGKCCCGHGRMVARRRGRKPDRLGSATAGVCAAWRGPCDPEHVSQ